MSVWSIPVYRFFSQRLAYSGSGMMMDSPEQSPWSSYMAIIGVTSVTTLAELSILQPLEKNELGLRWQIRAH